MVRKKMGAVLGLALGAAFVLAGCGRPAEPVSRSGFLLNTFVTVTLYDTENENILDGCMELCRSTKGCSAVP